jgi:hypothetical protein
MTTEKIWVSKKGFSLFTPGGTPLPVTRVEIEGDHDGEAFTELRLLFQLPPAAWARLTDEPLLGLTDDALGPVFGGSFHDAPDLEVTARLKAEHLPLATAGTEDLFDCAAKLLPSDNNPLRSTEAWLALAVMQQRGEVKVGMSTTHASD